MEKNWTIKVFFITFILALLFSFITNFLGSFNNIILIICILLIVFIGIIFDLIGVSVLSCNKKTLHSKASQKIKGAKMAIRLANNASSVSSFCNDVVGDVCGIISGCLVAILIINLFSNSKNLTIINVLITCVISSLTVGGKAIGKKIAIKNCDKIVFNVGYLLSIFSKDNK